MFFAEKCRFGKNMNEKMRRVTNIENDQMGKMRMSHCLHAIPKKV